MAVPKSRRSKFGREEIQKSLGTKELTEAVILIGPWVEHYTRLFNAPDEEEITHVTVRQKAFVFGTHYRQDEAIVSATVEDSVAMLGPGLEMLGKMENAAKIDFATVGGVIEPPALTMRQALDQFQTDSSDMWMNLSHRERQKKWNKYKEAVADFEGEMGADIDVLKLTKKDVYEYRNRLIERVKDKTLKVDTIRKKLMWLRVIIRHNYEIEGIKESPFENLRPIKGIGDEEKHKSITEAEAKAIRKQLAEADANEELRAILAVMENTGALPKECALLHEDDIHLDAPIPYVSFRPNENRSMLKTDSRVRDVPLVGIALEAMNGFRKGFPRYCRDNGGEAVSAAANKHIQAVAADKTCYGYRHRMANLMKAAKVDKTLRDGIMGHASGISGHYGDQYPLEVKLEVLMKVLPEYAY